MQWLNRKRKTLSKSSESRLSKKEWKLLKLRENTTKSRKIPKKCMRSRISSSMKLCYLTKRAI